MRTRLAMVHARRLILGTNRTARSRGKVSSVASQAMESARSTSPRMRLASASDTRFHSMATLKPFVASSERTTVPAMSSGRFAFATGSSTRMLIPFSKDVLDLARSPPSDRFITRALVRAPSAHSKVATVSTLALGKVRVSSMAILCGSLSRRSSCA